MRASAAFTASRRWETGAPIPGAKDEDRRPVVHLRMRPETRRLGVAMLRAWQDLDLVERQMAMAPGVRS